MFSSCSEISRSLAESTPFLALPRQNAPVEEWIAKLPIAAFPPLPARGEGYFFEPAVGIITIGVLVTSMVCAVFGCTSGGTLDPVLRAVLCGLILLWAIIAILSTAYILFAGASEVQRSPQNCYPIPEEVAMRLLEKNTTEGMRNVPRPPDHPEGGTFCVRCLVWRPPKAHHCQTCQRCVTGFDHHCGFYGRCIVRGNMICFTLNFMMLLAGLLTTGVALCSSATTTSSMAVDEAGMPALRGTTTPGTLVLAPQRLLSVASTTSMEVESVILQ
mmetsp:Transcript_10816/g.24740  ORF Transcript_10816/g.24740 Transcript_10816/m.24740 type:complete len:273 (-) Transcript_10816:117-935(-)